MSDETSTYVDARYDPTSRRMKGMAAHDTEFDVPYISHVEGNLWQGGCANGLVLPTNIEFVVSLYPWEQYTGAKEKGLRGVASLVMYDNDDGVDVAAAVSAGHLVSMWQDIGPTLVHCQAGLNRSSLVAALALMIRGRTADEAITLLRAARSPAVLCNRSFERWLRNDAATALGLL